MSWYLLAVHRETVSGWVDLWATLGLCGLYELDHFAAVRPHRLTLGMMDKAPIPHSEAFAQGAERWLAKGIGVHFLPPYCPELNRIERLWRRIKYAGLPFSAYTRFAALQAALLDIFRNIGSKYQITFA